MYAQSLIHLPVCKFVAKFIDRNLIVIKHENASNAENITNKREEPLTNNTLF